MKLEWMGEYRDIIGDFYRSANGYSQICKEELFGDRIRFSPYEVQILEHVMEHADEHRNMKWYAEQLGLSQATYSKYVRKLVEKGLLEKYHTEGNRKDIILMVSPLGLEEYERYARRMKESVFRELFDLLDSLSPEEQEAVRRVFSVWGRWHKEGRGQTPAEPVSLVRIG